VQVGVLGVEVGMAGLSTGQGLGSSMAVVTSEHVRGGGGGADTLATLDTALHAVDTAHAHAQAPIPTRLTCSLLNTSCL
jgi:hypothetical protein